MYRLAFKNFIRSRSVLIALLLFIIVGIISIFIGKRFLDQQQVAIQAVTAQQEQQIARNVNNAHHAFGLLMYYLRFAYIHQPDAMASLAIGQQDINASIQYLTVRGLEGQRYDTDLVNPYNQLTGNLDLSFVILFLFPLLIIAFNFNVLSQETENGTWSLVNVQAGKPFRFILLKLSIRLVVVLALLLLLLSIAVMVIGIPLQQSFLAFTVTAVVYILFWFAVSLLVIVCRQSSSISALLLLSSWVLLCLLGPAIINNYLTARYPVNEAYDTFLKQRDGYHTKWDADAHTTIQTFFNHYPQYSQEQWSDSNYLRYYAMQQLGDDEAATASKAMYQKLQQRLQSAHVAALFFPAMQAQLLFTDIAGTGLRRQLQFLDSTAVFHEQKRLYFYPKIFNNISPSSENWSQQQPEYFRAPNPVKWFPLLTPFVIFIVLLCGSSILVFKKNV